MDDQPVPGSDGLVCETVAPCMTTVQTPLVAGLATRTRYQDLGIVYETQTVIHSTSILQNIFRIQLGALV